MTFPDAPRVNYESNPLAEVICQLQFPTILKIDSEIPSLFQEKIRNTFPIYSQKAAMVFPPDMPLEVQAMIAGNAPIAHEFTTADGNWKLVLTREFIALTCARYDRWENFKTHLKLGTDALQEIYQPAFFTRLGLRYRDVINRSTLGIVDKAWDELLNPWIAGALASNPTAQQILRTAHQLVIKLPESDTYIQVNHGLNLGDGETTYLIDADLYKDNRTEVTNVIHHLDFLNKQSRLFFRWCITDELHNAMRPIIISSN